MFICSVCKKAIAQFNIKYYTPDQQHFFCDAYCSNEWYSKHFEKMDAKKDQTENE